MPDPIVLTQIIPSSHSEAQPGHCTKISGSKIGSHYHFFEVNPAMSFDRAQAFGVRLDNPAGTAVCLEPGQSKTVTLVTFGGRRDVTGFHGFSEGPTDAARDAALELARAAGFKGA